MASPFGFGPSQIVLGPILGQIAEQGSVQTYTIANSTRKTLNMFFGRPISIGIVAAAAITLLYPILMERRAQRRAAKALVGTPFQEDGLPEEHDHEGDTSGLTFTAGFVVLGALIIWGTRNLSDIGSIFHQLTVAILPKKKSLRPLPRFLK